MVVIGDRVDVVGCPVRLLNIDNGFVIIVNDGVEVQNIAGECNLKVEILKTAVNVNTGVLNVEKGLGKVIKTGDAE